MSGQRDSSCLLIAIGFTVIAAGIGLTVLSSMGSEGFFFIFPFFLWTGNSSPLLVAAAVLITLVVFLLPLFAVLRLWRPGFSNESASAVCPMCQGQIQADASFCPYCGTTVRINNGDQET
jgi:hypothetical protein